MDKEMKSRRFEVRLTDRQRQKLAELAAVRQTTPSEALRSLMDEAAKSIKTEEQMTNGIQQPQVQQTAAA